MGLKIFAFAECPECPIFSVRLLRKSYFAYFLADWLKNLLPVLCLNPAGFLVFAFRVCILGNLCRLCECCDDILAVLPVHFLKNF